MKPAFPLLLLLAACGQQPPSPPANEAGPQPSAKLAEPAPKAFVYDEKNDLIDFHYSWSAEAGAVPQLVERFRKDMAKVKAESTAEAKEDRDGRAKDGSDYHPHEAQRGYETVGQTSRLLSLEMTGYGFTGGAHGTGWTDALLWERQLAKEVEIADLLRPDLSWTGAIRQPFCILLDREREKRRGEPVRKDDLFGECPRYEDVTVLLADKNGNGRFDHIVVIADQYVAGPYAEGPYEVSLPITATMIDRLKPDYRSSFEPQPPVQ